MFNIWGFGWHWVVQWYCHLSPHHHQFTGLWCVCALFLGQVHLVPAAFFSKYAPLHVCNILGFLLQTGLHFPSFKGKPLGIFLQRIQAWHPFPGFLNPWWMPPGYFYLVSSMTKKQAPCRQPRFVFSSKYNCPFGHSYRGIGKPELLSNECALLYMRSLCGWALLSRQISYFPSIKFLFQSVFLSSLCVSLSIHACMSVCVCIFVCMFLEARDQYQMSSSLVAIHLTF